MVALDDDGEPVDVAGRRAVDRRRAPPARPTRRERARAANRSRSAEEALEQRLDRGELDRAAQDERLGPAEPPGLLLLVDRLAQPGPERVGPLVLVRSAGGSTSPARTSSSRSRLIPSSHAAPFSALSPTRSAAPASPARVSAAVRAAGVGQARRRRSRRRPARGRRATSATEAASEARSARVTTRAPRGVRAGAERVRSAPPLARGAGRSAPHAASIALPRAVTPRRGRGGGAGSCAPLRPAAARPPARRAGRRRGRTARTPPWPRGRARRRRRSCRSS